MSYSVYSLPLLPPLFRGADLAQDYSERSRLYGWREIMACVIVKIMAEDPASKRAHVSFKKASSTMYQYPSWTTDSIVGSAFVP